MNRYADLSPADIVVVDHLTSMKDGWITLGWLRVASMRRKVYEHELAQAIVDANRKLWAPESGEGTTPSWFCREIARYRIASLLSVGVIEHPNAHTEGVTLTPLGERLANARLGVTVNDEVRLCCLREDTPIGQLTTCLVWEHYDLQRRPSRKALWY